MQTNGDENINKNSSDSTNNMKEININEITLQQFLDTYIPNFLNVKSIQVRNVIKAYIE